MRKCVYLVTLIFLLSMAGSALADQTNVYRAGPGQGDPCNLGLWDWLPEVSSLWSDGNNWVGYSDPDWYALQPYMPDSTQTVCLNRGWAYPILIDAGTAAVANILHVGFWDSLPAQLDVTGGTLDVVDRLSVGTAGDDVHGYMNIHGGTITVGGPFVIGGEDPYRDPCSLWGSGRGVVYMTGGTATVAGDLEVGIFAGTGRLVLTGGTIDALDLQMTANGVGSVVTGTGMIILSGNRTGTVQGYIDSGWLSAETWYDPGPGKTYVIPEPATLALLGMGGLVLLRRKR